jgi:hypothetical protein
MTEVGERAFTVQRSTFRQVLDGLVRRVYAAGKNYLDDIFEFLVNEEPKIQEAPTDASFPEGMSKSALEYLQGSPLATSCHGQKFAGNVGVLNSMRGVHSCALKAGKGVVFSVPGSPLCVTMVVESKDTTAAHQKQEQSIQAEEDRKKACEESGDLYKPKRQSNWIKGPTQVFCNILGPAIGKIVQQPMVKQSAGTQRHVGISSGSVKVYATPPPKSVGETTPYVLSSCWEALDGHSIPGTGYPVSQSDAAKDEEENPAKFLVHAAIMAEYLTRAGTFDPAKQGDVDRVNAEVAHAVNEKFTLL